MKAKEFYAESDRKKQQRVMMILLYLHKNGPSTRRAIGEYTYPGKNSNSAFIAIRQTLKAMKDHGHLEFNEDSEMWQLTEATEKTLEQID